MTVAELIKKLQLLDQNATIYMNVWDSDEEGYIPGDIEQISEYSKDDPTFYVIEG
jgi:hypothetical protein